MSFKYKNGALGGLISIAATTAALFFTLLIAQAQDIPDYLSYAKKYESEEMPDEIISIEAVDRKHAESGDIGLSESEFNGRLAIVWGNENGKLTYKFNVAKGGLYLLWIDYHPYIEEVSADNLYAAIMIDGGYPFKEAASVLLPRQWKNETAVLKDEKDNDIFPLQKGILEWTGAAVRNSFCEPYYFYLEKGEHTLTIQADGLYAALSGFSFRQQSVPVAYAEIKPDNATLNGTPEIVLENDFGDRTILVEGESPYSKSSPELCATSDNSLYHISPSHPRKRRINTVGGGDTWSRNGQSLTYEFGVSQKGYYRFTLKVRQANIYGLPSVRSVYIDGEIPCTEFREQLFEYSQDWYKKTLCDKNGEDIYIFLEEGNHKITFEAAAGGRTDFLSDATAIAQGIEDKTINNAQERIYALKSRAQAYGGRRAASAQLQLFANSPDGDAASLRKWISQMSQNPLELDYIEVSTVHEAPKKVNRKFLKQLKFNFSSFLGSFTKEKNIEQAKEAVEVAVSGEYYNLSTIQEYVNQERKNNEEFPPVNLKIADGSLVQLILSGNEPDVFLYTGSGEAVQAAGNGLLEELTQFSSYHTAIADRFSENSLLAYTVSEKVYGLPLSESLPVMFFRSDILEQLSIAPPETADEFEAVSQLLAQNGKTTSNFSWDAGKDEFSSNRILKASNTSVFSAASFIDGSVPLVIADYTAFRKLLYLGNGGMSKNYDFAPIPGKDSQNGIIYRTARLSSKGGVILESTKLPDEAWEVLSWFASDEIQTAYYSTVERKIGGAVRALPANQNAIALLPVKNKELRSFILAKRASTQDDLKIQQHQRNGGLSLEG